MIYNYWVWYNSGLRSFTDSGLSFWMVLGFCIVASTIIVPFRDKSPHRNEASRIKFTSYYVAVAFCIALGGLELASLSAIVPPSLIGYYTVLFFAVLAAFGAVLTLIVLPYLRDSRRYFALRRNFNTTIRRIAEGTLTPEMARETAKIAPIPPGLVKRPPLSRVILLLSGLFIGVSLLRTAVQAVAISRAADEGTDLFALGVGMPATSENSVVFSSFIVVAVWAGIAIYSWRGSATGRTLFTVLLTGAALFGVWGTFDPQAAGLGLGQVILGASHPTFTSFTSFLIAVICIAILIALYSPQMSQYYRDLYASKHVPFRSGDDIEIALSMLRRGANDLTAW